MRADVRLSTRFLTTQNAHQVGMLVTLDGETPVRRAPINVALVLDRSGSMARHAARGRQGSGRAGSPSFLTDQDRLSIVTFDDTVRHHLRPRAPAATPPRATPSPESTRAARPTCPAAGSRAASWCEQGLVEGTNRVVLLTDGQANVGIVEPDKLVGLARRRRRPPGHHHLHRLRRRTSTRTCSSRWPAPAAATTGTSSPTTRWPASSRARSRAWSRSRRRTSRSRSASPIRASPASASSSPTRSADRRRRLAGRAARSLRHLPQGARPPLPRRGRLASWARCSSARSASRPTSSPRAGIEHRTIVMPVIANLDGETMSSRSSSRPFSVPGGQGAGGGGPPGGPRRLRRRGERAEGGGVHLLAYAADPDAGAEIEDRGGGGGGGADGTTRPSEVCTRAMAMGTRDGKVAYLAGMDRSQRPRRR